MNLASNMSSLGDTMACFEQVYGHVKQACLQYCTLISSSVRCSLGRPMLILNEVFTTNLTEHARLWDGSREEREDAHRAALGADHVGARGDRQPHRRVEQGDCCLLALSGNVYATRICLILDCQCLVYLSSCASLSLSHRRASLIKTKVSKFTRCSCDLIESDADSAELRLNFPWCEAKKLELNNECVKEYARRTQECTSLDYFSALALPSKRLAIQKNCLQFCGTIRAACEVKVRASLGTPVH